MVSDQYTPKSDMGYSRWIPKSQISEYAPNYEACKVAIVDSPIAFLYHSEATMRKFLDVSFNTKLPVLSETSDWIQVQTASSIEIISTNTEPYQSEFFEARGYIK